MIWWISFYNKLNRPKRHDLMIIPLQQVAPTYTTWFDEYPFTTSGTDQSYLIWWNKVNRPARHDLINIPFFNKWNRPVRRDLMNIPLQQGELTTSIWFDEYPFTARWTDLITPWFDKYPFTTSGTDLSDMIWWISSLSKEQGWSRASLSSCLPRCTDPRVQGRSCTCPRCLWMRHLVCLLFHGLW